MLSPYLSAYNAPMAQQRIPFDAFTLAAVAAELRALAVGAYVQKVQQPSGMDLIVSVYGRGGARRILLSADPQMFRICLTNLRRENPLHPPHFCQVCRKYLEGATLTEVIQPRFDRVLHLVFRAPDGERVMLAAELMGRNANLVLVSGSGTVRAAIRAVPADAPRPLRPGAPYAAPPGSEQGRDSGTVTDPQDIVFAALPPEPAETERWLGTTFSGISRFAAAEVVARAGGGGASNGVPAAFVGLMDDTRAERFAPHSIGSEDGAETVGVWAFAPLTVPPGRRFPRESISTALDTFYSTLATEGAEESERTALRKAIAREIAHRRREIEAAQETLREAKRADDYERIGNTLLAHLGGVPRGAATVTLTDPYAPDGISVTISLEPTLSPHENAARYFTRARKARDAAEYATDRAEGLAEETAELEILEAELARNEEPRTVEQVREAFARLVGPARAAAAAAAPGRRPAGPARPPEKPFGGHRIRTFTVEGYDLLVGESAEANDYLTTRVAAPSDLWMHVRAAPGAHAVLRTNGHPERIPDAVIRRAAQIVAARSSSAVKHASLVAVDVVEKRHVRKPRGARPGEVLYSRERVFDVAPNRV